MLNLESLRETLKGMVESRLTLMHLHDTIPMDIEMELTAETIDDVISHLYEAECALGKAMHYYNVLQIGWDFESKESAERLCEE